MHTDNKDVVSICLKLGCVGLRLDHPDAWPTVSCFFHTFLTSFDNFNGSKIAQNVGKERQMYFIEVVRLHCKAIIDSLLYCTAGGLNLDSLTTIQMMTVFVLQNCFAYF